MFKEYLLEEYTERVAKGYVRDFESFNVYLNSINKEAVEVEEADVLAYIQMLRDNEFTASTINKRLSLLRKYFKFLRSKKLMIHNPMDNIKQSKLVSSATTISDSDYQVITDILLNLESMRDKLVFHLLINEGLKPAEIIQITKKDINVDTGMLFTNKRAVPLKSETLDLFKSLDLQEDTTFIFTNQHGHPLKESGIYFVIKKYFNLIGYDDLKPSALHRKKSS